MHETIRRTLALLALPALALAAPAQGEEIRPGVLRTPDARFESLPDFPYAPNYV